MKIAWIDDDIEIIDPVIQPIVEDGHDIVRIRTVDAATSSADVLNDADLILLDLFLPVGDSGEDFGYYPGISLLRKLREEHHVTTPVVVFSVVDQKRLEEQLDSLGVAAYVLKPALPSELRATVYAVLST